MEEDSKQLGSDVELSGFKAIDAAAMIVAKKMIGNYAKKISENCKNMQTLHITLKPVHEREKSEKYELHAKVVDDGKVYTSVITERNLFVAIDNVLKKIMNEMD